MEDPDMYRSAGSNMDHLNYPALPLFSSHNSSISVSHITSDPSIVQQDSQACQNSSLAWKRKRQQAAPDIKSPAGLRKKQHSLNGEKLDILISNEIHDRPRLDNKQDTVVHPRIIQIKLQGQDDKELQGHSAVLQAIIQQDKLENKKQQKVLRLVPELQGVELKKHRQQQMKDYLQQLALQEVHNVNHFSSNVCSRRLTQYMYHLQHRPLDNSIAYWKKFVAEYYAPSAKKRWCFSRCDYFALHAICDFPRAAVDTWECGLCRTKCGRGLEATAEILPRLNKIQFESGVINELLFLESPRECRLPSGLMMLEYEKAVHETVFDLLHVVHKGKLRIIFTVDLKILSWEFCSHNHEELLPRSSIASQVNEFVDVAQKFQTTITGGASDNISPRHVEESHNILLSAYCKLQRNLNLSVVEGLGVSKRYIRCLQIADVLNSMKDLMSFSWENTIGPIESLKNYSREITSGFRKDEYEQNVELDFSQAMPGDTSKLSSSEKVALMLTGDYCKLQMPKYLVSSNISSTLVELSRL